MMRLSRPWPLILLLVSSVVSLPAWASDTSSFHFEISDKQQGPGPLSFPLGLSAGQSSESVNDALQAQNIYRGEYDKDYTVWNISRKFAAYKSFEPAVLSLTYKNNKLMQATLVQPGLSECSEIVSMMQDAVAYLQSHYVFPADKVQPSPHFGTNNCVLYMKPGQCGWQVVDGDYAVSVDSNWHDGKDMSYTGFVAFTYLPLYNNAAEQKK